MTEISLSGSWLYSKSGIEAAERCNIFRSVKHYISENVGDTNAETTCLLLVNVLRINSWSLGMHVLRFSVLGF